MLICDGQEAVKEHEGHFSQSGNLTVVSSASGLLDIMVSNITKDNAVKILAEKLNVDLSEVITFGNNYNDLSGSFFWSRRFYCKI